MPTLWISYFRHPFIRCLSLYARFGKCYDCVVTWYVGISFSQPVPTQLKLHFLSSTNSFLANMGHLGLGAVVGSPLNRESQNGDVRLSLYPQHMDFGSFRTLTFLILDLGSGF